jgi:cellulose synthase operon protein C
LKSYLDKFAHNKFVHHRLRTRIIIAASVTIIVAIVTTALALRTPRLRSLRAAFAAYGTLPEWFTNTESGSAIESALYRLMTLPTGDVLYLRPPAESRTQLSGLVKASDASGALYSLRALQDEQALDFTAAEADWKAWASHAPDRAAGELDLADFYSRRLRYQDEIFALTVVAQSPAPLSEKFVASNSQRSWKAFERILAVIQDNALGSDATDQTYRIWIARYPAEPAIYSRFFDELLNQKGFDEASKVIDQYSHAFPSDSVFPIKAQASLAYRRGSLAEGLAVYDKSFQPLWPPELIQSYFNLLKETRSLPSFLDRTRAQLSAHPDDLNSAARLFYAYQQQGRLDAAKQVIADYRQSKEARTAQWTAQELYTFARLLEGVQAYPESARYYFALNNSQGMPEAQQRAVAGLIEILLDAPEQPFRLGAGNLSMYRDIATMDQGPGYLNGILSLFFNTTYPSSEYSTEDQLATSYFHRAKAAELLARFDTRFPNASERAALHVRLIHAYGVYSDNDAVIRAGREFLTQFPKDPQRVDVALTLADAYARTNRTRDEFALYDQLLRELAAQADGVPLGDLTVRYSKPVPGQNIAVTTPPANTTPDDADDTPAPAGANALVVRDRPAVQQAFSAQGSAAAQSAAAFTVRSPQYEQILDRYLARLVATENLPQALTVLRGELDRDPNDPGIYQKLADFLSQNQLGSHEEEVYRRAIQQFDDKSWYAKLARYYIREKRNSDYATLTSQVTKIFSGTELESYFNSAPAPGAHLSLQVNLYAHKRFPHDLAFTRNLLSLYRTKPTGDEAAWQTLLAENWFEDQNLRNEFFEYLSRTNKLDSALAALREQNAEVAKSDWSGLAARNPAAARFLMESGLWQSHFEDCAPIAGALAAEYPADSEIGSDASSLYRSLAYFDTADRARAVTVEKHLLDYNPGNLDTLARIGDIYADRTRFAEAAPYWFRMAVVHPGESNGYLQSATVFWDYFDFNNALAQLEKGRQKLADPSLYSYESGAIYENQRDYPRAIAEYVRGAVANKGDSESRNRLLALATRPAYAKQVDGATASLLTGSNPPLAEIALRIDILKAQRKNEELTTALNSLLDRSTSFDVFEYIDQVAREQSLVQVQQHSLQRQIAITTDPTRRIQLRYELVNLYDSNRRTDAAQNEVDAIYRDNPTILGVVRSTVDYDWSHNRKPQAVSVLEDAAHKAYPDLARQFDFEAARKLTELGQYAQARTLLDDLLQSSPYDGSYLTAVADTYARAGDDTGLRDFYQAKIALLKDAPLDRAEKTAQIAALRRGLIPALTRLRDPASAVDQYIELINAYPDDDGLDSEAAIYAARYQQQPRLLDFYRKTVSDSPRDSRWMIVLARLETTLEDYPAAIDAYSKAIVIRPDRIDLYTSRAALNQKLQHYDDAIADYEKLYNLTYKEPSWLEKAAETRARQGKPDLAVAALEKALIEGKQARPADYFEVARQLESWNMLAEARTFAEKGADLAGPDLLASISNHSGAALYARILTRLRKPDVAYARLSSALTTAGEMPGISATLKQSEEKGIASVTNDKWREQQRQARLSLGRVGFAAALKEMATTAHTYYTPEETQSFVQLLETRASGVPLDDLNQLFLPAAEAGSLIALQSDWKWRLASSHADNFKDMWKQWGELQRSRLSLDQAGQRLEGLAPSFPVEDRTQVYRYAAQLYRDTGSEASELRCLENVSAADDADEGLRQQYYSLLLTQKPQKLVELSSTGEAKVRDAATQYAVLNAEPSLALEAVRARGTGLAPVWTLGYIGITGLYLNQFDSSTGHALHTALGDASIGDRIGKPVDRNQQLAGNVWFYYGSRYGEYLSLNNAADADDYLPSTLELQPESADAYAHLAAWYGEQGKVAAALDEYNSALQLHPGDPMIYDQMAVLLWKDGRKNDAIDAWKNAAALIVKQIDQRKVPESFWPNFATIVGHLGSRGQFQLIRPQIDSMLRTYIKRNGSYMTEPLLQAVYKADGNPADATTWILELAAVGDPPDAVLDSIVNATWLPNTQRPRIYARQVEIAREKVASSDGEARNQAANRLRDLQVQWIESLFKISDYTAAKQQLDAISDEDKKSYQPQWMPLELKLAAHDGTLSAMVEHWKQNSADAPSADLLRNAASGLDKSSRNIVLSYVYQTAIDSHDLSATNFLGLADIRIDDGDISGAAVLLKRMVLVSNDQYTDLDSAAALLTRTGHDPEAIPFLTQLSAGVPWQPAYRLRLDTARLKANQDAGAVLGDLSVIAKNQSASYDVRTQAAQAIAGKQAAQNLGSAELDLLARSTISSADAQHPYFIAARIAAAKSAPLPQRITLLRQAVEIAPQNDAARLPLIRAALEAKDPHLVINAAEPYFGQNGYPNQRYWSAGDNSEEPEEATEGQDSAPDTDVDNSNSYQTYDSGPGRFYALPRSERAAVLAGIAASYRQIGQPDLALSYFRQALGVEPDASRRKVMAASINELRQEIARRSMNIQRAPAIHETLDQNHPVRPRLQAFVQRSQP